MANFNKPLGESILFALFPLPKKNQIHRNEREHCAHYDRAEQHDRDAGILGLVALNAADMVGERAFAFAQAKSKHRKHDRAKNSNDEDQADTQHVGLLLVGFIGLDRCGRFRGFQIFFKLVEFFLRRFAVVDRAQTPLQVSISQELILIERRFIEGVPGSQ